MVLLSATINIPDSRIRNAFETFLQRMPSEVLDSFNDFLTEVSLVDSISSSSEAVGVCEFVLGVKIKVRTHVKFYSDKCQKLSEAALIGMFAHEFGHVEDRLFNGECADLINDDVEATANTLAIIWGFKDEIYQLDKELGYDAEDTVFEPYCLDPSEVEIYWETRRMQVQTLRDE